MLELKDVRVAYGNIEVLHKINIEVKDGEIVTIIGANGARKDHDPAFHSRPSPEEKRQQHHF